MTAYRDFLDEFVLCAEHELDHGHHIPPSFAKVMVERAGQVLLVRDRDRQRWELPGGGIEDGETPRLAAIRELAEEAGIETEKLIFVAAITVRSADGRLLRGGLFRTVAAQTDPVATFQPTDEIAGIDWFDRTAIPNPLTAQVIRVVQGSGALSLLPGDVTRQSYQAAAELYAERTQRRPLEDNFLDRIAERIPGGRILEIGSGPGWDADYLEARGYDVTRTDVTPAFVETMRSAGHDARILDARTDDLGGPWDAILANAVLLHLTRSEFADFIGRARTAVRSDGLLAITLKEGDGERWSEAKLDLPRYFVYWREEAVRAVLERAGWTIDRLEHRHGTESWLFMIARAAPGRRPL